MRRPALFVLLTGLLAGLAAAQPPAAEKKAPPAKDKKEMDKKEADKKEPPKALPDASKVDAPDEKSFTSADGVKLRGLFYKSLKGPAASPTVILLHEYKKDPNAKVWDDTARLLAAGGFNAFRFAFRGHGDLRSLHSKDVAPEEFFGGPYSGANKQFVSAPNPATKTVLDATKDFRPGYQPMLVQDIAAARTLLDSMNDFGECNTSSLYLMGAGDTVNLGFLFLASEWHRERERVRTFFGTVPPVSARRGLIGDVGAAGQDYAGAVWLGPTVEQAVFPPTTVKQWVDEVSGLKLRNETPMLFLYGGADPKGKAGSTAFFDQVLKAGAKNSGGGTALPKLDFTHKREVGKGAKNAGAGLLGSNLGTEGTVLEYLTAVEKERKGKSKKTRDFEKPLYIDVRSFGVMQ